MTKRLKKLLALVVMSATVIAAIPTYADEATVSNEGVTSEISEAAEETETREESVLSEENETINSETSEVSENSKTEPDETPESVDENIDAEEEIISLAEEDGTEYEEVVLDAESTFGMTKLLGIAEGTTIRVYSENGYSYSSNFGDGIDRWIYVDGAEAYCVNPDLHQPASGTYSKADFTTSVENSLLLNVLYYGFEGPGDITANFVSTNEDRHTLTHIAAAKAYGGAWTHGVNQNGINLVNSFIATVQSKPQVLGTVLILNLKNGTQSTASILTAYFPASDGYLTVKKSSTSSAISGNNPCYDLSGIQFKVYKDQACSEEAKDSNGNEILFTTDGTGACGTVKVPVGSYWVREVESSITTKGWSYNPTPVKVDVTKDHTEAAPVCAEIKNQPLTDPAGIQIQKIAQDDEEGTLGIAPLSGAQFTITHYTGYFDSSAEADEAVKDGTSVKRTWVIETKDNGSGKYRSFLTNDYKVSGDDFYYSSDENPYPVLPLGTVTIAETKAPEGYLLDGYIKLQDGTTLEAGETYIGQIRTEKDAAVLSGGNVYSMYDGIIRGDLKFQKKDDFGNAMANVKFSITSKETGESHVIWTDANGIATTEASVHPHSVNTNAGTDANSGIWFGANEPNDNKGALPYGTYVINELDCAANKGFKLVKNVEFTVSENASLINLADIVNKKMSLSTEAFSTATGDKVVEGSAEASITDTVTYKALEEDKEYTLKASLIDKETKNVVATAEKSFETKSENGSVDVIFDKVDLSLLAGHTLVVAQKLYDGDVLVISHEDLTDLDQTVYVPKIGTTAVDGQTQTHTGNVGQTTIVDTVSYSNLVTGKEYTVKGVLMDKTTGEELLVNGQKVTAEKTFTAETKDGSVEITFSLDASALAGTTVVVFEDLLHNDIEVATHSDITDKDQTVDYPDLHTTAEDEKTGGNVGSMESSTLIDTVAYSNLIVGKDYTVKGVLMDKATGKELLVNGQKVTAETTFTATEKSGTVELVYTIDASVLAGKTVVVFEDLYNEGIKVTSHADIDDEDQSVSYPDVHTSAADGETKTNVGVAGKTTIVDTVTYSNLVVGKEYTVKGILMDKESGKELRVDGKTITAEATFTAETADGIIDLTYELDASTLAGKSTVVFEDLFFEDVKVASHAEIDDEGQTVEYPGIRTTAADSHTGDGTGTVESHAQIVDTVTYKNLIIGKEYTVKGTLMDKATGKELLVNGEKVTAETTFTAETKDGSVDLIYYLDSSALAGKTVVVFEDLYNEGVKVTSHADLEDEDQTIHYPDVHTSAKDGQTNDNVGTVGQTTIIDTVSYSNLVVGKEYTVSGILMDKDTKEALLVSGEEVTAEVTFTAEKANGTIDLIYTLDSSLLTGKTTVVFEDLIHNDVRVAAHTDINDEDQTVEFPEIHTTATDGTTDSKQSVTGKTTIIDTVEYKNLVIGKEYTVSGVLMNKETGEPVLVDGEEVTAETTFTAESKDGNIDLVYELDASALAGTTIVVFEDLYHAEVKVTSHADIEDEEQTVFVPKVGTTATVNGAKTVKEGKTVTLTDKVAYENLIPGEEYTLKGWIVNKTTGKEMDITAELTFTPEEANGTVDVEFTINTKGLADNELVVFEEVYMGETFISDHKDIDDEGQTVKVVKNPGTIITRTGDSTRITLLCITLAAALTVLVIAAKAKKAQNR